MKKGVVLGLVLGLFLFISLAFVSAATYNYYKVYKCSSSGCNNCVYYANQKCDLPIGTANVCQWNADYGGYLYFENGGACTVSDGVSQNLGCSSRGPATCNNGCKWTSTTASCWAYANQGCLDWCSFNRGYPGCHIATWSTGGYCSDAPSSSPSVQTQTYYTYYGDADSDTYGNPNNSTSITSSTAPAGYVTNNQDCNDNNVGIRPGATETCNNVDEDCDSTIDEGLIISDTCNQLGACSGAFRTCSIGLWSSCSITPGIEICNNLDDNCDGIIDEGCDDDSDTYADSAITCSGNFLDGAGTIQSCLTHSGDCDDTNSVLNPNTIWYQDFDSDGWGNLANTLTQCTQPAGYIFVAGDCNDNNDFAYPGASETCGGANRGLDNNCNGIIDEGCSAPEIMVISPINQNYNFDNINFEVLLNKAGGWCGYSLDSGNYLDMALISPMSFREIVNVGEGNHNVIFSCNDTANWNNVSANIGFSVDTVGPAITIYSPIAVSYPTQSILVNISSDGANSWYNLNGGTNNSFNLNFENFENFLAGSNTLNVYANDSAGNPNSESVTFIVDLIGPVVTIDSSINGIITNINNIPITYTYNEPNPSACSWTVNGGTINPLTCGANITGQIWGEGLNTVIVYVTDSAGNTGSGSVNFIIDTINPSVTISSPADLFMTNNLSIEVSSSVSDANLDSCSWTVNGGLANSITCGDNILNSWSQGWNNVVIYVNDSAGNQNSASVNFFIDSIVPNILITNPVSDNNIFNTNIEVDYIVSDVNLSSCSWTVNGGLANSITCGENITGSWGEGLNTVIISASDILGNANSATRTFVIDTVSPTISIVSPGNLTYNYNNMVFEILTSEDSYCEYSLDSGTLIAMNKINSTYYSISSGVIGENGHNILFSCNDSAGNTNTSSIDFSVDTIAPSLNIISPVNGNLYYGNRTQLINISTNSQSVWYGWNGANTTYFESFVEFNEGWNTLDAWAIDSAGNINHTISVFQIILTRTIANSWIYGGYYPNNLSSEVSTTAVTNTVVNDSTIVGDSPVSVTDSGIYNSTLINMSEILRCFVYNSVLSEVICVDATVFNSDIFKSNITGSLIINSTVYYSNVTYSTVINSEIYNSNVDLSTIIDSFINNSWIYNSTIINSFIINCTVSNSSIINTNISNAIIENADISNGIINWGNVTFNGTTYDAGLNGSTNITNVVNYPPTARLIITPTTAVTGTAIVFDGSASTDPNLPGDLNDNLIYFFNFGDGNNLTNSTAVWNHVYSSAGSYNATLLVTDKFGESSLASGVVTINSAPAAPSGGSGGGGSAPTPSKGTSGTNMVYEPTREELLAGYTVDMRYEEMIKFKFGLTTYYFEITGLYPSSISSEIKYDVIKTSFNVGDLKSFFLNKDTIADFSIKLNKINEPFASVTATLYDSPGSIINEGEINTPETPVSVQQARISNIWLWILVIIIILLAIATWTYYHYFWKKKNPEIEQKPINKKNKK